MRFAAGIIGIIGALAGLFLGITWFSDLNSEIGQAAASLAGASSEASDMLSQMKMATYSLLGCGVVGLLFSILIIMRKFNRWANAVLLIVCGGLPLVFNTDALFGTPMILGGLLALAVKYEAPEKPIPTAVS